MMTAAEHTTKAFDADLQELTRMVAEMGGLAEKQVFEAIEALTRRDNDRARWVIEADRAVDAMQHEIEERAVDERIGDLPKNIGKRIPANYGEHRPRRVMRGVNHLTTLLLGQLRQVLDSFVHRDAGKATQVWNRDDQLDQLYTSLFRELLTYMMEDPATITLGIHLLFCTKNLERMVITPPISPRPCPP